MKKIILIGIACFMSLFVIGPSPALAQQQERPTVRLIYFVPRDRQSQPNINADVDRVIKQVQHHYAEQMEGLGYGKKTFKLEIDRNGKVVVHRVKGKFNDAHYRSGTFGKIAEEINVQYNTSENVYFVVTNTGEGFESGVPGREPVCGLGGHFTLVRSQDECFTTDYGFLVAAHELGHTFGLQHDFRNNNYLMSYGGGTDLSPCDAEWLDVHRAFNPSQQSDNERTTFEMLPPNLASPPNVIRLRFKLTDPEGIHQARLHTRTLSGLATGFLELVACKQLNGDPNTTFEFVTTNLTPKNKSVSLEVIDMNGNFTYSQDFSVNIASLLPRPRTVSIPDANLAAAVRQEIGNSITTHTMLNLTRLGVRNRGITNLTGLEHAHNLRYLDLSGEYIEVERQIINTNAVSDFSPLSNLPHLAFLTLAHMDLSDISWLADLTQLTYLVLSQNQISDISPVADLTQLTHLDLANNGISDISPVADLTQLTHLDLANNGISDISPVADLTQLTHLDLSWNSISDISSLADLTQLTTLWLASNSISDVYPLVELDLSGTQWDSTGLHIQRNSLSYTSIYTHIPVMQAKGIEVKFDPRKLTAFTKRLGDTQQGKPSKALATPFVVEVKDEKGIPFAGVPIKFTVTAGGGRVRPVNVISDITGRAQTTLTLGPTDGTNTVRVTAADIQKPIIFSAMATDNPPPIFRKPTTFSVAENTTAIGRVKASDTNQQDSVTGYSINPTAGEDSAKFSITPTGVLSFKTPPNYERPTTASRSNEYIVLVSATGGTGKREKTGTQSIIITVTDVDEPPGVPLAPTVIPATRTSLIASWAAPENTGPPLTYEVRYREGNTGKFTEANYNGRETNFTLKGLKPGKKYQVRVLAKNDEGRSTWSRSGIGTPQASPPIDFPDVALRTKIADALGKRRNASITPVDMLTLTKLEAPNANIHNLTGLEHAHNLSTLNLGSEYIEGEGSINSNDVPDLSPLSGLTNLKQLYLSSCSISDVSPLSGLNRLTYLDLGSNNISDVSALSGLTQLRSLYLTDNRISNVSSWAGLAQLSSLGLGNNNISDISALSGLNQLTYLNLGNNNISDVLSLSGLTQLTSLYLWNNLINNVSPLAGLLQLTSLGLGSNNISNVSPLAKLTQLTTLYLDSNNIVDVSPLSDLMQLAVLHLYNNDILDVSPLVGLNLTGTKWNSTGLYLERNPLSYASINTHIRAMEAKGVEVQFNSRTPTTLVKISGVAQQGIANRELALPFVVEVRDERNKPFAGVPVSFTVPPGSGRLSTTSAVTDTNGRAAAHLTLGRTAGTSTVRVSAAGISQHEEFTATAIRLDSSVTVRDANLRAKIVETLGKQRGSTPTAADMLKLTTLIANSANIRDLTGLQHASNLTTLSLENNSISDITPLAALTQLETLSLDANTLSDITPIEGLTQLTDLSLDNNRLSDVFSLTRLSGLENLSLNNNNILDVAPLTALTQLNTLQLKRNPLSYPSLHTSIPTIQASGATVSVDLRTPTTLVKVSGTHGVAGSSLSVIVEVHDEQGLGFAGVPVTFRGTTGSGHLSSSNVITDATGRARTFYTLGATPGKNTIRATAIEVRQPTLFTITAVDASSPVTIRDANLRAKITETLSKSQNVQLTAGDMLALIRLEAPNANIQNLTGLEHAHNLTRLNLGGEYIREEGWVNSNNVSDFSPLFDLAQLTNLNLSFSSLTDVSFLSDMPQLTRLELYNNEISDISVFSSLTRLTSLRLGSNVISDASPLAGLTQLTDLDLSGSPISDVSSLSGLTQLRGLYLYSTMLSDVSSLSGLTQLTSLGMSSPTLSDISPLAGLTQLTYLYLGWGAISDISALAGLTQLTSLTLTGNSVADVSPLSRLTQLEVLNLRNNGIIDVSPLVELELPGTQWNSTGLYIERNPLNYASVYTHIPAMQARGVEIEFDNQAHSALVKVSGDAQEGAAETTLPTPLVVKAMDPHGVPIKDRIVRFYVEAEDHFHAIRVTTDANGKVETTIKLGPNPGVYRIRVAGEGITYPIYFTATATGAPQLAADVNGDGNVNIQDLVLVSSSFGKTGENNADVNSDGVVNISDLVLVAGSFGGAAAAPAMHPSMLAKLSRTDIVRWLDEAKRLGATDIVYLRGIAVLEQLLIAFIPKETVLLANYPNPFNPETWIPYQLAEPSEVTLRIYAVNGALVRTLALGHQAAGMYHSKSRAAYWDGRNEQGERVASGIYFYTLSAGDFAATRKMLIRK